MALVLSSFVSPVVFIIRPRPEFLAFVASDPEEDLVALFEAPVVWTGKFGGHAADPAARERRLRAHAKRLFLRQIACDFDGADWLLRLFGGDLESERTFDERFELELFRVDASIEEVERDVEAEPSGRQ